MAKRYLSVKAVPTVWPQLLEVWVLIGAGG